MDRAYSVFEVKEIDEEKRIIRGIATTPATDRVGDIVEPLGGQYSLPIPFLMHHDPRLPTGNVIAVDPSAKGIAVEIQLPMVQEAGRLKDRIDEAWQEFKYKLVRGLSIGFMPLESEDIPGTWGRRFIKWAWHELSGVTIPANAEANIVSVKSFDQQQRAASGNQAAPVVRFAPPAGATANLQKSAATTGATTVNISEQLAHARAARQTKAAQLIGLLETAGDTGATLDATAQASADTLEGEVKSLDAQIGRLERAEALMASTAKPVNVAPQADIHKQAGVEFNRIEPQVKAAPLKDGLAVARFVRYLGLSKGNIMLAEQMARQNAQEHPQVVEMVKAAVAAGTTTNSTWAKPLVPQEAGPFADFVEYLRPMTLVGKFGAGGVPSLRRVPFRVPLIGQTSGGSAYWVGEGNAKPLTKFDFEKKSLDPLKIAAISVITEELLADSSPSADALIRDQLVAAARARLDTDFIDPAKAAVAGISPASILNGVTALVPSGTTADNLRTDIGRVMAQFLSALNPPTSGVWIMDSITALKISLLRNALGTSPEFPGLTVNGGTLEGLPAIVSDYVVRDSAGGSLILVNAQDIYFGDDGDFNVDFSREASLQMDSAPTMDSDTPTAAQLVSMWQTNSVAFRVERRLNWMKRRTTSVAWLDGVNYGG